MFCREVLAEARQRLSGVPGAPQPLGFHLGNPDQGETFFSEHWPDLEAISDPEARFYEAFGRTRGEWRQLFGLEVWKAGFRAWRQGHRVGKPVGDPWRMPGTFVVAGERFLFAHEPDHAGDHPDWDALIAAARDSGG